MSIKTERSNIFEKLISLIKSFNPETLTNITGTKDFLLEEAIIADFVEYLKKENHPIVPELDKVGLIDYYNSVLHLLRSKAK